MSFRKLLQEIKEIADGKPFVVNIEKETLDNTLYRTVLYTAPSLQLVLMSIPVGEEIGEEVHQSGDQFIRIESGEGKFVLNGKETACSDGFTTVVPQGMKHNVVNTGNEPLKLYALYAPPEHEEALKQKDKPKND